MTTHALGTDHAGLEVLSEREALRLLATAPIGRVAFMSAGEPLVLPVNHAVDGRTVVFRTAHGTKLDAAWHGAGVAFEVDDYDSRARTGWSVLVRGTAEEVIDERELAHLESLGLETWLESPSRWVRVRIEDVSGRRLLAADTG